VRLGLLTSVCGFVALVFSGFPGLAQLGVFSVAGLVAAALTTRFVLPALMPQGAHAAGPAPPAGRAARVAMAVLPRCAGRCCCWVWPPAACCGSAATCGAPTWRR
jgi:predicted exporter